MASVKDTSKVDSSTERKQDLLVKPRKDDAKSKIPRRPGHKKAASTGSNNSPIAQSSAASSPLKSSLPLPVRANHGLTPKRQSMVSHRLSSDVSKDPVPENEDAVPTTPVRPDNTKDENEQNENEKDDTKNCTDEDSWPEDTDPRFLAEIAEYRRRGPVYTGEYRVKRLSRARPNHGPTLFIAPSAERLIMGTDDKSDVSSSVSVGPKLEDQTVSDAGAEESRVFDEQTATRDDEWPSRKESLPSYVTDDTAVSGDNEETMETTLFFDEWSLYGDPLEVGESVEEPREGEDKGKGRKEVSTYIKSQYQGPVARDDGWPVRIDSLPNFQKFSEGQGLGEEVLADIKSQFQGPVTRNDGWPVRIDSLPSFQKLSEGHRDESLVEQVSTDIKSQFQGPAITGWPVRKDSLLNFREASEGHTNEDPSIQISSSTLPHSPSLDDSGRPDTTQSTRTSRIGPSSLPKLITSHASPSPQPSRLPTRTPSKFYANLHRNLTPSASTNISSPTPSSSRMARLGRVISQSASFDRFSTARSKNSPSLPKSSTAPSVNRPSVSSIPKRVNASLNKRTVEETRRHTTTSTMKFPTSKTSRTLEGVRGLLSKSKMDKNEVQPADKKKTSTVSNKKTSPQTPKTPKTPKSSQVKQRGTASASAPASASTPPQSASSGSRSRTQGWSFARPTYSTLQRAAASRQQAAVGPQGTDNSVPTGPVKSPEGLWNTLVENSPRREISISDSVPLDCDPKEDPSLPPVPEPAVSDRHIEAVRDYIKRLRDMASEGGDPEEMAERISASNFLERGVEALLELQRGIADAQRRATLLQFQQVVARRALFRRFREVRAELDIDED
ncbi:hypothetical protein VTN77DRAFT_8022 [Rasamsonia byssochlamydoides]|uniref:uncharacterized protein n=1 Tax=Rasamsonia byssochlamydoides TaxID=89139 RepID=UPI00374337B2